MKSRTTPNCNNSRWLRSLSLLILAVSVDFVGSAGIPGTTQTISGYDTEMGVDPICWSSQSDENGLELPNPLIKDFLVSVSGVTLLRACPQGNTMSGVAPDELVLYGERLRTTVEYNFTVSLDINLTSLGATQGFTSDEGPGYIAVQVLNCLAGSAGFCSPFIHEEANARLAAAEAAVRATNPNIEIPPPPPRPRGGLHGGSHVHSGYTKVYLPFDEGPIYKNIQVEVPMAVLTPGLYFSMVSAQMYFENATELGETQLWRYDMGNALFGDQRMLTYQEPVVVLDVDKEVLYFAYCLIGVSSLVILFLLMQTIKHRDHQIMKLSQSRFLIVSLVFALVATATSFLLEPRNDLYCNASTIFTGICLQVVYAITLGRLWRIHALISPMLLKTFSPESTLWSRLVNGLKQCFSKYFCCCREHKPKKLRTQVSDSQLWIVFALLSAPQVIIQVVGVLLQPQTRTIDLNDDESKGRATCSVGGGSSLWGTIIFYGFIVFCILVISVLLMAWQSRKLPSLFNESKTIFDATLTSFIILIMGLAVALVTRDPTTSPSVTYLIAIFVVISITVNTSLRIVLPKLLMVWRGETVVVSKLVMDHTRKVRESGVSSSVYQDFTSTPNCGIRKSSGASMRSSDLDRSSGGDVTRNKRSHGDFETEDITESFNEVQGPASEPFVARKVPTRGMLSPQLSTSMPSLSTSTLLRPRRTFKKGEIVIESDQAPSRRLTLKMIDMQAQLDRVNRRIMSGMMVSHEDWEETRRLAGKFGNIFTREVAFGWEETEPEPENAEAFIDDAPRVESVIEATIEEENEELSKDPEFVSEEPSESEPAEDEPSVTEAPSEFVQEHLSI